MTLTRYFLWFAIAALWFALLSALQYPIRKKGKTAIRIVCILVKLLAAAFIAYIIMAVDNPVTNRLGFVLAPLYIVLLSDAAGDILFLPFAFRKKADRNRERGLQIAVCAFCFAAYLIYGTVNMQTVTANRFTVTSEKLTESYKVVFMSDLHVGSSQSMATVEKTIEKLDKEKADLVLLGGDIVDEFTTKEEMEKTIKALGSIEAPVYFVYGNHEYRASSFTDDQLEAALAENGIRILRDEWVFFADDLVIFGRDDQTSPVRKDLEDIPSRPEGAFVLSADHSPYMTEDIIESRADLQLSGHSHAGQLFPLRFLYRLAGYDAYGFFGHGETELYVSSGASGWSFPFRSEAGCHYEVIILEPEKQNDRRRDLKYRETGTENTRELRTRRGRIRENAYR